MIDAINKITMLFIEGSLYEVSLIRIKEQVDQKRSTVCTHMYAEHNKYVE